MNVFTDTSDLSIVAEYSGIPTDNFERPAPQCGQFEAKAVTTPENVGAFQCAPWAFITSPPNLNLADISNPDPVPVVFTQQGLVAGQEDYQIGGDTPDFIGGSLDERVAQQFDSVNNGFAGKRFFGSGSKQWYLDARNPNDVLDSTGASCVHEEVYDEFTWWDRAVDNANAYGAATPGDWGFLANRLPRAFFGQTGSAGDTSPVAYSDFSDPCTASPAGESSEEERRAINAKQ